MNSPNLTVPAEIQLLWDRINQMEQECLFNGTPYPEGMTVFPGRLTGQGFFPGGDGLWRDNAHLKETSRCAVPIGGIMFLGNDFGTLSSFQQAIRRGYENPPTWRNLKSRLSRAGIPGQLGFYTNAVLGLRTTKQALEKMDWTKHQAFTQFCRQFLEFQIETLKPRLIVVLGEKSKNSVCLDPIIPNLAKWSGRKLKDFGPAKSEEMIQRGEWGSMKLTFLLTSHPYSDFSKNEAEKAEEASKLKEAWHKAQTDRPADPPGLKNALVASNASNFS